jgi:hypothetical protein
MWYFLQNITLKMITHHNRSIIQKLEHTLAKGAYGFSKQSLHYELPDFTDIAIKRSLNRLSNKGKNHFALQRLLFNHPSAIRCQRNTASSIIS